MIKGGCKGLVGNACNLRSSSLKGLCPIKVGGVLRVGGRLQRSPLSDEAKHPIILPSYQFYQALCIPFSALHLSIQRFAFVMNGRV